MDTQKENTEKKLEFEKLGNGAFIESLKRNNSKIRSDRAESISDDAQMIYKR